MILTTKKLAEQYGIKESRVRRLLRDSDIPKVQEGYFWWIDEQYQSNLDKLFNPESIKVSGNTATSIIEEEIKKGIKKDIVY
jgi:hypothetical protein